MTKQFSIESSSALGGPWLSVEGKILDRVESLGDGCAPEMINVACVVTGTFQEIEDRPDFKTCP